ncbi:MAG: hypothetical protein E6X17_08490 [Sporomusaceae bacterium]|nr:hypothetical protein [Sporomusaceae bacterium]
MSVLAAGVVNSSYTSGVIGSVTNSGVKSAGALPQLNGVNFSGDPRVLNFAYNGTEYAMVLSYTYVFGQPGTATIGFYIPTVPKATPPQDAWTLVGSSGGKTYSSSFLKFSNPYSLVVVSSDLYVADYDSGKIIKVSLANLATEILAADVTEYYSLPSASVPSPYVAKCNGMDYVDGRLVMLFNLPNPSDYTDYHNSYVVMKQISTGTVTGPVTLNKNAVSVAADKGPAPTNYFYAYVCSIGGAQQAGGNGAASKLQVVRFSSPITVNDILATATPTGEGDFVDVAILGTDAYILAANYNSSYTSYNYQVIKTPLNSLRAASLASSTSIDDTAPAGATWMLAPSGDSGDPLWFVSGNEANTLSAALAVSLKATPADLGIVRGSDNINVNLNTAAVVIAGTTMAARAAAVSAARTKLAVRLSLPQEIEEQAKAQAAATKQK